MEFNRCWLWHTYSDWVDVSNGDRIRVTRDGAKSKELRLHWRYCRLCGKIQESLRERLTNPQ